MAWGTGFSAGKFVTVAAVGLASFSAASYFTLRYSMHKTAGEIAKRAQMMTWSDPNHEFALVRDGIKEPYETDNVFKIPGERLYVIQIEDPNRPGHKCSAIKLVTPVTSDTVPVLCN